MPEDIQQNIVQEVPVVDVPTQNVVQTIDPENPVYKFMKANKLTTLSEKDFVQKYSTPEKAKEIHSFMVTNKLTTLKDNDFYGKYFPAASTITVTDETGLKKKVLASSDPALQNLLTFIKSGKNIGKPVDAKVTQQVFSDKNQILAPNLVVPTNTREAALANRKDNWNKLVEDASFRAVEKTVNKNSKQGVSYSREKIQGMVDDYKKKVNSGELIISEDPATGKDVLATPNYNPFSSLLSTYNKGNEQKYEDAYFEGLSLKEKIKHKEVQQYLAQDDDSIPERPAGFFGNLGGFGGQLINMLEKPVVYSIGLASGAGAVEAATLGTTALSTAGGLSNVGNTLGFMSDMANSSYSPTWDKVYYGNLQGVENPTEEQKLTAASKATEAANYSKSIGGAEGLIFGLPFGNFSKSLESSSKGFVDNLLANGKNTMKHAPQMVGTSIAGQIGKGEVGMKYGSGETQSEIIKEGLNTGVETAKFLATMSGLGVIKSAVPYAFTLLANTKESPSKSLTAKAKAVVSNFPDEVIADVYNQAEQNGIIEPGKTNDILNNIQKYREAEASVPSNVTNADARDAIAGKLEKLDKLDQEGKLTKVNARKIEIEKEKAEINKEIDNIYNGDDVLANEKDNAGYPLKERSEVGKAPVLAEETVTPVTPEKPVTEPVQEGVKPTEGEIDINKRNKEYPSPGLIVKKFVEQGDNQLLTGEDAIYQNNSIERTISSGIKKGLTADEIKMMLNANGHVFNFGNDDITINNYIKNRINGTETRPFGEFKKNTRVEISEVKPIEPKEEVKKIEIIKPNEQKMEVKPTEVKVGAEKPSKEVVFTAYGTGDNGYVIEHAQGIEKKDVKRLEDARSVVTEQVGLNNEQKAELENTGSLITENKTLENGDKKITVHFKNRDAFGRKGGSRFDLVIPENNASTAEGIKKVVDNFYAENDVLGGKRLEGSKYIQEGVKRVQKYLDTNKLESKPEVKPTKEISAQEAEVKFTEAKARYERARGKESKPIVDKLKDEAINAKSELDDIRNKTKVQERAQPELKPIEKEVFKSSQGNAVDIENGKLVVKDKKGEVLSDRASRKAIEEYAENFDYSKGDKAPEVPLEITNSRDAAKYVVEESSNPIEIAEIYASEDLLPKESNAKFQAIAEYGLGRIKTSSYKNLGDPNKIEKSMYLKIFSEERGTPIDVLAKSISDKYEGLNIEPQDIVDYIEKYSKGDKGALEFKESDVALQAADKFNKLTGLDLNSELANKVIDNKLGKANKDQLEIIKQDYETAKQLEDAYWAEYKKTDGFTKESNISKVNKPEPAKEPSKKLEEAYKDLTNIEKRQIINSKFEELLKELKIEKICPTD